ncbi:DUF2071 domain-containing protein [Kamptonema cortianum]|nr:DUF2071 domain-containing protein [Geitlerinema splendidum]MDK3155306.1 DUF2071 domain-containing protein [Kamptonema cortianum]
MKPPESSPVMFQSWRHLTFIHWPIPVHVARRLVPPQLEVDTFHGQTYVGLVPFTMHSIRPIRLPAVPWLSAFHETNVRLYVRAPDGTPGVYFLSLDAERLVAVLYAQSAFQLPYKWSRMILDAKPDRIDYWTNRIWPGLSAQSKVSVKPVGESQTAEPDSLNHFLIERYRLFVTKYNLLYYGAVHHQPYQIQPCELIEISDGLVYRAGIQVEGSPASILYSPGTDVTVWPILPCNDSDAYPL